MAATAPQNDLVPISRIGRIRQAGVRFLLQACVWFVLSLAIAAMLVVGQPFEFLSALRFSAANWMPWALITPIVFWASARFPIVRGHLLRSVPVHLLVGLACTVAVAWISLQLPFALGPLITIDNERLKKRSLQPAPVGALTAVPALQMAPQTDVRILGDGPSLLAGVFGSAGPQFTIASGPLTNVVQSTFVPVETFQPPAAPAQPAAAPSPNAADATPAILAPTAGVAAVPAGSFAGPVGAGVLVRGAAGSPPRNVVITPANVTPFTFSAVRPPWNMMLMPLAMRANAGIAIYLIIATAAHAMAFYRQAQERERQSLALLASRNQAKLDALRLQLQPHFLFNTLNAISTLVHRDPEAADNLIGDLSDLLRVSLQTTAHEVPLARELELLDHYLAIEQARLGDRLRIVREIAPDVLGAFVPTLILQPLAENAVRHGLEPRLAPGTLTLRARRDGDSLRLSLTDDGVGFDPGAATTRRGIGLANSEERLRTLHNDRARLEIIASPAQGVRVEIELPFRREPVEASARSAS